MRLRAALIIVVLLGTPAGWAGTVSIQALIASGEYDNDGEANSVDREAAGNRKTLEQFETEVTDAFRNNTGGVITFDQAEPGIDPSGTNGRSGNYPVSTITVRFGADKVNTLKISADDEVMNPSGRTQVHSLLDIWQGNRLGPLPISGPLIQPDGEPGACGAFLTPGTGLANDKVGKLDFPDGQIRQLGLTALSAGQRQEMKVTAYFSGGQSESQTETIEAGAGADDVFFYFAAPPHQTIVSIRWESDVIQRPGIDDLAFLTAAAYECLFIVD